MRWLENRITVVLAQHIGQGALSIAHPFFDQYRVGQICQAHLLAGSAADAFENLILELAKGDQEIAEELGVWRKARQFMLNADDPTILAHESSQATAKLFYHAVWMRLVNVAKDTPQEALYHSLAAGLKVNPSPPWV